MSEHDELIINGQVYPYPSGHNIYWEPWIDAYNNDGLEDQKQIIQEAHDDEENLLNEDLDLENIDNIPFFQAQIKTILTPFGVLPLTEESLASNHFKFWVGHANFKLWDSYYQLIGDILGVESVDILTPLRFRIAVGKMFKDTDVLDQVRLTLIKAAGE